MKRRLQSLQDLGALRTDMEAARRAAAERDRQRHERETRERQATEQFAHAVGPVHAVRASAGRVELVRPRPEPQPLQRLRDEQAAAREAMSDEVDVESLLLTDDGLSFRRHGVGPDVLARLRRGHWALQDQIDLHGFTRDEARERLAAFVREAHRRGLRCVRVVHGKGHGSPGRQPVLKSRVQRWLAQRAEVMAFAQASGPMGGAGALLVLLAGRQT